MKFSKLPEQLDSSKRVFSNYKNVRKVRNQLTLLEGSANAQFIHPRIY